MEEKKLKFYEEPLLTWFLLVIYPPFGIIFLWLFKHFDVLIRFSISILFGLIYLEFLGYYSSFIRALIYSLIFAYIMYRYYKIKDYEEKILDIYQHALNHEKIKSIFNNYFQKFAGPTHCFNDLLYFELYLRNKYKRIYKHLTLSHLEDTYINIVYKESEYIQKREKEKNYEINTEENKQLENELIQLRNIINQILNLKGDKFTLYFTFQLLKQLSINYYADLFDKIYGSEFKKIKGLNEAICQYVSIDSFNIDINSKDLTMFTYYLMKKAYFEFDDFYTCINILEEKLKDGIKERKEKIFKSHLFNSLNDLIKEVETIDVVNNMKSQNRFMKYVFDLLTELGYENIRSPLNSYISYIVTLNDYSFGVNVVYNDNPKNEKNKSTIQTVQDMKLGLVYNELDKGIIITNGSFTKDALKLANKNDILLWDNEIITEKAILVKRYYKHEKRKIPENEIKFDDISTIPFEKISIDQIDQMSGHEFQYYLAELFKRKGFKILSVHKSRDKGVDIILEKNGVHFGVQAKRCQSNISKDAIKEIVAGMPFYNLKQGFVITNNTFNEEALMLARICDVITWDRNKLVHEISYL